MTQTWRKGDRIRILVPTVGGWQGEAILIEDEMPECDDDLVYWRRAEDDDPEREDGCCIKAEVEWIRSADEAHLSPAAQAVFNAAWADTGIILGDREGTLCAQLAAALRALANHQRELRCSLDDPIDHWRPDQHTRCELRNIAAELENQ